jgi:hypothetical protein
MSAVEEKPEISIELWALALVPPPADNRKNPSSDPSDWVVPPPPEPTPRISKAPIVVVVSAGRAVELLNPS